MGMGKLRPREDRASLHRTAQPRFKLRVLLLTPGSVSHPRLGGLGIGMQERSRTERKGRETAEGPGRAATLDAPEGRGSQGDPVWFPPSTSWEGRGQRLPLWFRSQPRW